MSRAARILKRYNHMTGRVNGITAVIRVDSEPIQGFDHMVFKGTVLSQKDSKNIWTNQFYMKSNLATDGWQINQGDVISAVLDDTECTAAGGPALVVRAFFDYFGNLFPTPTDARMPLRSWKRMLASMSRKYKKVATK